LKYVVCKNGERWPYRRSEWRLVGNRMMCHVPFGAIFQISSCAEELTAVCSWVREPDRTLSEDVETLRRMAPRAYLDAIGFKRKPRIKELRPN
jgi:hypothetical protein